MSQQACLTFSVSVQYVAFNKGVFSKCKDPDTGGTALHNVHILYTAKNAEKFDLGLRTNGLLNIIDLLCFFHHHD